MIMKYKLRKKYLSRQSGQVAITAVLFFLMITTTIGFGIINPALPLIRQANDFFRTRGSFFVSQAANEDVLYRLKNNKKFSSPSTLSLDGYSATATSTNVAGDLQINSSGNGFNLIRNIQTHLISGSGASFNYGIQTGEGGLILEESSSVLGNVYSNGSVIGNGNVNTSNASNPPLAGVIPVGWGGNPPIDVAISGNYAYVLCASTFMVVDISNKASPTIVKTVTTAILGNHAHFSIAVSDNHLYIVQGNDYVLSIYNITDPLNPVLLPSVNIGSQGGYPKTVTVYSGYAYVTRYTNSGPTIQIINVSNPASATLVKTMTVPNWPRWITFSGGYMYVTFDQGGSANMQIYSLTNPANPTLLYSMPSNIMLGGHAREYIAGKYMYTDNGDSGRLHVTDITNKSSPTVVFNSTSNIIRRPTFMDGAAGYLYISENTAVNNVMSPQVQVWSIANPILPVKVNTISIPPIPWGVVGVVVKNGYLYILDSGYNDTGNLRIYHTGSGSGGSPISGDVVSAGSSGLVDRINSSKSIYSNTIKNSVIENDVYYDSIITSSAVGGASYPGSADQALGTMPIPDTMIDQWEADATAGGVINSPCPYKINSDTTIGPVKINCDLEVSGNTILSLAGMVWVKGNVTLSNNGTVQIASSIPGRTAAIIADDPSNRSSSSTIKISNNTNYLGNGTNSYVMFISQNNSAQNGGSAKAIEVTGNVSGKLLVYAAHGEIVLANNSSIKEVTGWRTRLKNSAQVLYETGLANLLFTSGPSGGFSFDKWREVE